MSVRHGPHELFRISIHTVHQLQQQLSTLYFNIERFADEPLDLLFGCRLNKHYNDLIVALVLTSICRTPAD